MHIYNVYIYTCIYIRKLYSCIYMCVCVCVCVCVSASLCISKDELCKSFESFCHNLSQEIASSCYGNNAINMEVHMILSYDFYRH